MRRFKRLIFAAALLCVASSCERDDVDEYGDTFGGYGSDLVVCLANDFSESFPFEAITCEIRTSSSEEVLVTATHALVDGESVLLLDEALPVGRNILRSVRYTGTSGTRSDYSEVPLGCSIDVSSSGNSLYPAIYDKIYSLYGDGTVDNPYQIASAYNFAAINEMDDTYCYFEQAGPIDFLPYYGHESGFDGVCSDYNRPFKGVFYGGGEDNPIKNLAVRRYTAEEDSQSNLTLNTVAPAGLFSCVSGAVIQDIYLDNPDLSGDESVGGIVGLILGASAESTSSTIINNCHLIRSEENSNRIFGSMGIGGIVGNVEYMGSMTIQNCSVAKELILEARSGDNGGSYLGGIVGASGRSASIIMTNCVNHAPLSGDGILGIGGIIASAETITMTNCTNNGSVTLNNGTGETIAVGGLIGGSTHASIIGSTNNGSVSGTRGVGGLLGSTIYDTGAENAQYGNVLAVSSHNYGSIRGTQSVGGLVGEAQASFTNCLNSGSVSSHSVADASYSEPEVGGLIGFGSFVVARGSHNTGSVYGHYSGGISGLAEHFFIYGCSNFGVINGTDVGGMIGKTCEYGLLNYGVNYARIYGSGSAGGLVGTLGEHLSTSDKLSALYKDLIVDAIWFVCKWGSEVGSEKIAEWFENKTHKNIDAGMGVVPRLVEVLEMSVEVTTGILAGNERDEIMEELEEIPSEIMDSTQESIEDMDSTMNTALSNLIGSGSYKYNGALSLTEGSDISKDVFNNLLAFAKAVDSDDTSTDAESEGFSMMTVNSYNDLAKIGEDTAKAAFIKEIVSVAVSCAVAIACMGTSVGYEIYARSEKVKDAAEALKTLKLINKVSLGITTAGAVVIDAACDATDTASNTILINQGVNFGSVNGNGLIGTIGDRIGLRNSLSAGSVTGYSVAGDSYGRDLYDANVVCIGDMNKKPYEDKSASNSNFNNFYCYGDGSDGTYTADQLKSAFTYGDDDKGDEEYCWNWNNWQMSSGGIVIPSNSEYLMFL